jgi:CRP/FNR family transcriptional regulator, cyclic AMP receptor protein
LGFHRSAADQFLRTVPLFGLVETSDLETVGRLLEPIALAPGEVLFREGEPGRSMWVLGEGVELSVTSSQGGLRSPVVVMYAQSGDVVGELALVDEGRRSGTAVVVHGGLAHQLDGRAFQRLRAEFSPIAFQVLRKLCVDLCAKLRQTDARIVAEGLGRVRTPQLGPGPHPEIEELERFPPFRGLPSLVKLALAQKLEVIEIAGVTPLFAEQEPSDGAWFLLEGEVTVGRNGRTLANLPAGVMFGQVACIDNGPRSAACVTAGPARLFRMSERDFDQLFASGHRFAFQMVDLVARQLARHLREANRLLPVPGRDSPTAGLSIPVDSMLKTGPPEEVLELIVAELEVEAAVPLELELELAEIVAEDEPAP